jgi:hypothetical protein
MSLLTTLLPDAIAASSKIVGSITDIDEGVDNNDANYVSATGGGANCRVSFPSPGSNLVVGAGLQKFRATIFNNVGSSQNIVIKVYESGTLLLTSGSLAVASDSAWHTIEYTWNASALAAVSGANAECRVDLPASGLRIGAVEWVADITTVDMTATGKTVGSPVFGAPAIMAVFTLAASFPPHGPVLGIPDLGQIYNFVAAPIAVSSPELQRPGVRSLAVGNFGVGRPEFGTPILRAPWRWVRSPTVSSQLDEAGLILSRALDSLLASVPGRSVGRPAWDFRRAVGIVRTGGEAMIADGTLGTYAALAWELARTAGAGFESLDVVRTEIVAETPFSVPGQAVAHLLTQLTLQQMALLASLTTFESRDDAAKALARITAAFEPAESDAADEADAMAYRSLVAMRAAIVRDLAERGRQLPRLIRYSFNTATPALWLANRLYADGARSDQLRAENKWVHPLFARTEGVYLSR